MFSHNNILLDFFASTYTSTAFCWCYSTNHGIILNILFSMHKKKVLNSFFVDRNSSRKFNVEARIQRISFRYLPNIGNQWSKNYNRYQNNYRKRTVVLIPSISVDTERNQVTLPPKEFLSYNMKGKVIKSITLSAKDSTYKYESYKVCITNTYIDTFKN